MTDNDAQRCDWCHDWATTVIGSLPIGYSCARHLDLAACWNYGCSVNVGGLLRHADGCPRDRDGSRCFDNTPGDTDGS